MGRISHVADYVTMRRQYRPLSLPRYELDSPNMRLVRREYGWGFSLPLDAVVGEPAVIAFVVNPGTKKRGSTLKRIDYEVQINNRRTPIVAIRLDEVRGVWHVLKGGRSERAETIRSLSGLPTIRSRAASIWISATSCFGSSAGSRRLPASTETKGQQRMIAVTVFQPCPNPRGNPAKPRPVVRRIDCLPALLGLALKVHPS